MRFENQINLAVSINGECLGDAFITRIGYMSCLSEQESISGYRATGLRNRMPCCYSQVVADLEACCCAQCVRPVHRDS